MEENNWQKKIANDSPGQKRKKPFLIILVAILILVLALLLLCVIPGGHKVLAFILPTPRGTPVISSLAPIGFQEITPPAGGGSSRVIFPVGSTIVDVPSLLPSRVPKPAPTPTPIPTPAPSRKCSFWQTIVSVFSGNPCPASGIPKPGEPTMPPIAEEPKLLDFGDAPDGQAGDFPSLLSSNGARHIDVTRFYLGKKVDVESDSYQVDKDSPAQGIGPDDGAASTPQAVGANITGWVFTVEVHNNDWPSNKPIYLNALVDDNGNLKWDVKPNDPEEHVLVDEELFIPKGKSRVVSINVSNNVNGPHWVRFTVTQEKLGAGYNGSWPTKFPYGETEDYVVWPFPPEIVHDGVTSSGIPREPIKVPRYPAVPNGGGKTVVPVEPARPSGGATAVPGRPTTTDVPTYDPKFFTHNAATTDLTRKLKYGPFVVGEPIVLTFVFPQQGLVVSRYGAWDKLFQVITSPFSPLLNLLPESLRTVHISTLLQERSAPQTIIKTIDVLKFVPLPVSTAPGVPVVPDVLAPPTQSSSQQVSVQIISQNTLKNTFIALFKNLTPKEGLAIVQYFDKTGTLISTNKIPIDPASSFKEEHAFPQNSAFAKLQVVSGVTESVVVTVYSASVLIGGTGGGPIASSGCAITYSPSSVCVGLARLGNCTSGNTITVTASDAGTSLTLSNQSLSVGPEFDFAITNGNPATEVVTVTNAQSGPNTWTLRATPNAGSSCSVANQAYSITVP